MAYFLWFRMGAITKQVRFEKEFQMNPANYAGFALNKMFLALYNTI